MSTAPKRLSRVIVAALLAALVQVVPLSPANAEPLWSSLPSPFGCSRTDNGCVSHTGFNPNVSTWGQDTHSRGNCTNYAAYRLERNGATRLAGSGNAITWADRVRSQFGAAAVNQTPAVGSIAYWGTSKGEFGHVAYVEHVDGSTVYISDSVWAWGSNRYTKSPGQSGYPEAFLHIADRVGPGISEGSFVNATDTGRVYRIAGGAPIYISSWAPFGGPQPTSSMTQAAIDAIRDFPKDGTTIAGAETGQVYMMAGGAPIYLNPCEPGCGQPVAVNQWSIDTGSFGHLRTYPRDGTTLRAVETGQVYKVAGGAPIYLNSCDPGCGSPVSVNQYAIDNGGLGHLRAFPSDDTTLVAVETGQVYKVAGGAPIYLNSCDPGCGAPVSINQHAIDNGGLGHLRAFPADGTTLRAVETARVYKVAGGAPLHLQSCESGCGSPVGINQYAVDSGALGHLRGVPADGTLIRGVPSGTTWVVMGGKRSTSSSTTPHATVDDGALGSIAIAGEIVPGSPRGVRATSTGPTSGSVTFSPPSSDGGSAITGYQAQCTSTDGGLTRTSTGTTSPRAITALTEGKTYQCRVRASNAVGNGPFSAYTATFIPRATPPGAPRAVAAAVTGATSASVTFSPPTSDGGSPITGYQAQCTSTDGGLTRTSTGTTSPRAIAALTEGKTYQCRVRASNAVGNGEFSSYTPTFIPRATPPGAPRTVAATATSATSASVTFSPPASNGGSPITGYQTQCTSTDGGLTRTSTGTNSPLSITAMTAGRTYQCRVRAGNDVGNGEFSAYTTSFVPTSS